MPAPRLSSRDRRAILERLTRDRLAELTTAPALDDAVNAAYGVPAGQEGTEFLLELNQLVVEDEAQGRAVQGSGLPAGLDARDPRWTSADCIEPPKER